MILNILLLLLSSSLSSSGTLMQPQLCLITVVSMLLQFARSVYMNSFGWNSRMPSSTIRAASYFSSYETLRLSIRGGHITLSVSSHHLTHHSRADKRTMTIQTLRTNDRSLRLSNSCAVHIKMCFIMKRSCTARSVSHKQRVTRHRHMMMAPKCMEVFLLHRIC